jgi:heat shock protein HtpX
MFKRIFLFLLTNLLVIITISLVTSLLGLKPYLTSKGINYQTLIVFCAIWGTGGAFISLWISKWIAKRSMDLTMIDQQTATGEARELLNIIQQLARKVGLATMPEVGIYDSPELNAFATGPSKKNALVAVSSGLLNSMREEEVRAVLGHEISHVANGDMVTMTLIQGITNAFALFLSRIVAYVLAIALSKGDTNEGFPSSMYFVFAIVFDILFTLLGSIVVAAFSRWREYRADAGGAKLTGKSNMIAALRRLETGSEVQDNRTPSLDTLKISQPSGLLTLFASHPSIEHRIKRLEKMSVVPA